MPTLLVLGSKPNPILPPRSSYDDLACANASGHSAARHGLPTPSFTVISAMLTSGKQAPNTLSFNALAGLRTERLYFYPRPARAGNLRKRMVRHAKAVRMTALYCKWKLRTISYNYHQFITLDSQYYLDLIRRLCDDDAEIGRRLEKKGPSVGLIALALGIAANRYTRYIVSGFSFEITHAYGPNPLIEERGTATSRHADTDIAILGYLSRKYGNVYTTEPVVADAAGLPLLVAAETEAGPTEATSLVRSGAGL